MRYLWVEDFNDEGNGDTESELEKRLIDFFDLQNDKIIIKKTLSSAINFLENKENFDEIDAVLIDIRFPEGDESELHSKYFSHIVTPEFYSNNIEDASGIMLYLLLVFRYHISQKKMAFISANISSDNIKLKKIQDMVEIIAKSKYVNLSDEDKEKYLRDERDLGVEILKISSREKEWDTFISKDRQVESIDLDKLLRQIRLLPLRYYNNFKKDNSKEEKSSNESFESNAQVKYNAVKNQFDKIGFSMPSAFEKPKIGEKKDKSYSFMQWETELYMNSYNAIRSNIQEMCIILIDYFNNYKTKNKIYSCFLELLTCNQQEKCSYDESFFIRYLKGLKGIFAIDCMGNIEACCERALKEITALWEASAVPKYTASNNVLKRSGVMQKNKKNFEHEDNCYYACHAILKIARNWIGHQGINNINIIDVGLIFLLNIRGIFDIDNLPEQYMLEYKKYEENILLMYELNTEISDEIPESLKYFCNLNDVTLSLMDTKVSREGDNPLQKIYNKISGLGHSQSEIRTKVSMDEIYMLLYHILAQDCDSIYVEIKERIKARTWKNWRERYNERFRTYVEL